MSDWPGREVYILYEWSVKILEFDTKPQVTASMMVMAIATSPKVMKSTLGLYPIGIVLAFSVI